MRGSVEDDCAEKLPGVQGSTKEAKRRFRNSARASLRKVTRWKNENKVAIATVKLFMSSLSLIVMVSALAAMFHVWEKPEEDLRRELVEYDRALADLVLTNMFKIKEHPEKRWKNLTYFDSCAEWYAGMEGQEETSTWFKNHPAVPSDGIGVERWRIRDSKGQGEYGGTAECPPELIGKKKHEMCRLTCVLKLPTVAELEKCREPTLNILNFNDECLNSKECTNCWALVDRSNELSLTVREEYIDNLAVLKPDAPNPLLSGSGRRRLLDHDVVLRKGTCHYVRKGNVKSTGGDRVYVPPKYGDMVSTLYYAELTDGAYTCQNICDEMIDCEAYFVQHDDQFCRFYSSIDGITFVTGKSEDFQFFTKGDCAPAPAPPPPSSIPLPPPLPPSPPPYPGRGTEYIQMAEIYVSYAKRAEALVPQTNWDFTGSLFFAFTLLTTIGYGNYAPVTDESKLAIIILLFPTILLFGYALGQLAEIILGAIKATRGVLRISDSKTVFEWSRLKFVEESKNLEGWQRYTPTELRKVAESLILNPNKKSLEIVEEYFGSLDREAELEITQAAFALDDFFEYCQEKERYDESFENLWTAGIFIVVLITVSSFVFQELERRDGMVYSILDSIYFLMVSFSTLGLGDIVPSSSESQIFWYFYLIFGLGVFAAALSAAADVLSSRLKSGRRKQTCC